MYQLKVSQAERKHYNVVYMCLCARVRIVWRKLESSLYIFIPVTRANIYDIAGAIVCDYMNLKFSDFS